MKTTISELPYLHKVDEAFTEECCPPSPQSHLDMEDVIAKKKPLRKSKRRKTLPKYVKYKDLSEREETKLTPRQLMMVMRKKGIITDGIKELDRETKIVCPGAIPDRKSKKNLVEEFSTYANMQSALECKVSMQNAMNGHAPQSTKAVLENIADISMDDKTTGENKWIESSGEDQITRTEDSPSTMLSLPEKLTILFKRVDCEKESERRINEEDRLSRNITDKKKRSKTSTASKKELKIKMADMEEKRKSLRIRIKLDEKQKERKSQSHSLDALIDASNNHSAPVSDNLSHHKKESELSSNNNTVISARVANTKNNKETFSADNSGVEEIKNANNGEHAEIIQESLPVQKIADNICEPLHIYPAPQKPSSDLLPASSLSTKFVNKDSYVGLLGSIQREMSMHTCPVRTLLASISKRLGAVVKNPQENAHMHNQDAFKRVVLSFRNIVQHRENCCMK
ncbi:hypothetical protein NEMIN01_2016 [Nematocida minor]|uniref:uncharacterized protein n=1 Tax=Nematocida minor TaxID=1912983 RepID=UPI0022210340|nr:uncharacterized protein NEMIN01_2016 [Nematocida minor]KAI5192429.1 hypothetical protein NEMIN01_2016 [Nematocida minor]